MAIRLPDWLIYLASAGAVLGLAALRYEDAGAPPPPPPVPGAADVPLPANLPFDRSHIVKVPRRARVIGTAFSVSADGVWLTAGEAAHRCRRPVIVIAEGRGIEAGVEIVDESGVMVLTTVGGAPPIAIAPRPKLNAGRRVFVAGYPMGRAGEATGRLIGEIDHDEAKALNFAESGRTKGIGASLEGLAGSPVLGADGRAVGVLLADSPRRGTLVVSTPEAMALAVAKSRTTAQTAPMGDPITLDNYYRLADALRRDLSVAPLRCLRR